MAEIDLMMKKTTVWGTAALLLLCLPWNLTIAWPTTLLIWALWGEDLRWERSPSGIGVWALTCRLKPDAWFTKRFYAGWGGTTLGHGIFYGPLGRDLGGAGWTSTQRHEHVHVEQFEASTLSTFVVGLLVEIVLVALGHPAAGTWLGMVIWWLAYPLMGAGGWLVALLRNEDHYRGSHHEEAAYAVAERDG